MASLKREDSRERLDVLVDRVEARYLDNWRSATLRDPAQRPPIEHALTDLLDTAQAMWRRGESEYRVLVPVEQLPDAPIPPGSILQRLTA